MKNIMLALLFACLSSPLIAGEQPMEGSDAPSFKLQDQNGEWHTLEEYRGQWLAIYFYPKDDTPGCTTQACGIRDAWGELSAKAKVFGVSIDPIKKHGKFISKYELPFPLISDEGQTLVESYGVWVEKQMYGKTYMGTERTTFVINEEGIILAVFPKVKPADHVDLLLEALG